MNIAAIRSSLAATENTIYLNSGASAPSPRPVLAAITDFLERQTSEGPFSPPILLEETRIEDGLRETIADVIGAARGSIALSSNTTDGINLVSNGVDWREGDEVITCDQEHPSGLLPWFYLRERFGIVVKVVCLPQDGEGIAKLFEAAIGPRTRLISLSHVSWCTGVVLPITEIADAAHRRGAALLVDGAQGPGHLPVDVQALGCDFYALSGQKWLMGPHGTGALYVSAQSPWQPRLSHLGWASAPIVYASGEYVLHPDARQYEYATSNHGLLAGFQEALNLYVDHGPEAIWQRILNLSGALVDRLKRIPRVEIVSPRRAGLSSGLVSFRLPGRSVQEVVDHLWNARRIVCRWVEPEAIRISVHIFNTEEELDVLAAEIGALS